MRKAYKNKVHAIQEEQAQLAKIERTLETLLAEIKDSINTMMVEQLQLRCNLVDHFTHDVNEMPMTSAQAAAADVNAASLLWTVNSKLIPDELAPTDVFIDEGINKQLIDLESLLVPMTKRTYSDDMEEEEEDEDDGDDDDGENVIELENGNKNMYDSDSQEDVEDDNDSEFLPETH